MKIAVLGAGAYGTALGGILAGNGYDVDYYDVEVEKERLCDVLAGAKVVVLCVPSNVAPHLLPYLPKDTPLVVTTKGILSKQVFDGFKDWMVLSGPGFANDIKAQKPTFLTATDQRITEWLRADYMQYDLTADRRGVLMCGALKNIYAILAGYLGLERETVAWQEYIAETAREMREILVLNGAEAATVDLACGIGDLKLTCGLPSRNYEFGARLRQDPNCQPEKTVEGLSALKLVRRGAISVPTTAERLNETMEVIWG